jgi:hypothetical protein
MSFASPNASKNVSSDFKTLPDGLTKFICKFKFNLLAILVASSVPQRIHSFFLLDIAMVAEDFIFKSSVVISQQGISSFIK